jgi:hypothetical protein
VTRHAFARALSQGTNHLAALPLAIARLRSSCGCASGKEYSPNNFGIEAGAAGTAQPEHQGASSFVANVPTPQWSIVGTGDFNGDGLADILWQDTSGNIAMWYMNGTAVSQHVAAGSTSLVWTIQGAHAD